MNLKRAKIIGIATAGALLLVPGSASAATLSGNTNQPGETVELRTSGDGSVKYARVTWSAKCKNGAEPTGATTYRGFKRSSPQGFAGSGVQVKKQGKLTLKFRTEIEGKARNGGYKGTIEAKVKVSKKGQNITTCKTGKVRWTAQ